MSELPAGKVIFIFDNEKCFVFDITPYSLRDRAIKLQDQKML